MDRARHRAMRCRAGAEGRFRFLGGEEQDEAAGLRAWEGNGTVRLHAACDVGAAYGLLLERCLPGSPLREVLPERTRMS